MLSLRATTKQTMRRDGCVGPDDARKDGLCTLSFPTTGWPGWSPGAPGRNPGERAPRMTFTDRWTTNRSVPRSASLDKLDTAETLTVTMCVEARLRQQTAVRRYVVALQPCDHDKVFGLARLKVGWLECIQSDKCRGQSSDVRAVTSLSPDISNEACLYAGKVINH